ncbi:MAG: ABC transporter ATP-binding protein [Solirubrobacteraceae bacterium]
MSAAAQLHRIRSAPRVRALTLMWQATRPLSLVAALFVVAEGALPVLVLVAMGRVTGDIPGAVEHGLSSGGGHRLIAALAIAGGIYALSLMRGPLEDALTAAVSARVDVLMQRRLVTSVSAPVGIEHLEDETLLDRLASAQGELLSNQPSNAPMSVVSLWGDRLTGILACVVLAAYRWYLGLGLLVMWLLVRRPLSRLIRSRTQRARSAGPSLRRSWYMLGLAWKPPAAKEMRVFGLADWVAERHSDEWLDAMRPSWAELRRLNARVWMAGAVVLTTYMAIAAVIGIQAYHGSLSLTALATMMPMLPSSLAVGSITYADVQLELALSSLPDLDAIVDGLGGDDDPAAAGARSPAGLPRHQVRFDGVGYSYPGGDPVLSEVTLELSAGQSLGLVGVNGAGKSTLITLLARMREPSAGTLTIDGVPLDRFAARAWQRMVAVVYQDFARLPLSAAENVGMFGDGRPDPELLERVAARAGAGEIIASLPRGWSTILSPQYAGGVDLSGGQWQRIALARALYAIESGATLLVLDEPTSQLDIRGEAAFYDRFLELTEGVTSIVISHRFASVRRADRIAVLDGGRITELGTHAELLDYGGVYATMFRAQAERFADPVPGAAP